MAEQAVHAVIQQHAKVLIRFGAKWCGPCKSMEPSLQRLEGLEGPAKIVRIDIEDEPNLANQYSVRAVPTLMLFEDGVPTKTQVGALPFNQLQQFVEG